jgi:pimeloyl-ACP methyl ester carboxylesterase
MSITVILKSLILLVFISCSHFRADGIKGKHIVFVHGANFDSSSWTKLRDAKALKNVSISSVDLPGRTNGEDFSKISLKSSARFLCNYLKRFEPKKIVVIVHSQGGAVLHKSIELCNTSNIDTVIYIAAVMPLGGETPFEKLSKKDSDSYFAGIKYQKKACRMKVYDNNKAALNFANDGNRQQRKTVAEFLIDEPSIIGEGKVSMVLNDIKELRKYYVYTLQDRIISFETQKRITGKIEFDDIYEIDSGHLPMVTKTQVLSNIILKVLKK